MFAKKIFLFSLSMAVVFVMIVSGCSKGIDKYESSRYSFDIPKGWKGTASSMVKFIANDNSKETPSNIAFTVTDYMLEGGIIGSDPSAFKKDLIAQNPNYKIAKEVLIKVGKHKAYRYEIEGTNKRGIKLKAIQIVIKVADKLYMVHFGATPENYEKDLPIFEKFLKSIKF